MGLPIEVVKHHIETYGPVRGLHLWFRKLYLRKTTSYEGTNVFDEEWDMLVLLDACRPDLLSDVADQYTFLGDCSVTESVGEYTAAWIEETFSDVDDDVLANTAYITGNPYSEQLSNPEKFLTVDEVWRYAWDDDAGAVRPRPVTDRAIQFARETDFDRLIVHYLQPHIPFLESDTSPTIGKGNFAKTAAERVADDWELVAAGERSLNSVWADYRRNLEIALDDVGVLLENVDAPKTVISADHGNAVGEQGVYGHPGGVNIPAIHKVPWCKTTASDENTHSPADYNVEAADGIAGDRLEALGYR